MFLRTSPSRLLALGLLASCSFGGLLCVSFSPAASAADMSTLSEVSEPEVAKPEVAKSEVAKSEVAKSEVAKSEVAEAEVAEAADSTDVQGGETPVDIPVDPGVEAQNSIEMANYSDGKVSLDYPATWQVDVSEDGAFGIVNVPETPLDLVETNLYQVEAPPGPLVNANIDSFIEEGAAVSRYRSVTIDDQSALVIWLAERPGELSSAIATFIGYGDETIFLFSRYSPDNADAEQNILRLHGSFVNLSANLATDSEPAVE